MELNICFTQGGDNMPFLLEDALTYLKIYFFIFLSENYIELGK